MKTFAFALLLAVTCGFLQGCASPASTYAGKHPELSAEQRKILTTGKIPAGGEVAGMTREQVRLAMGSDPAQFTKIEGNDAWVYVREKDPGAVQLGGFADTHPSGAGSGAYGSQVPDFPEPGTEKRNVRTTILFQGDRAIRAEVSEEAAPQ
jgi:outer membrane protein assembly factor BamE (lipoprotein component of BamABCDE complex)